MQENTKLSVFIFFLIFLSGRLGLLIHEFAGHALSWRLFGGELESFGLFLFGGGWVHYGWTSGMKDLTESSFLLVQLSGILAEFLAGAILCALGLFRTRHRLARAFFSVASSVLIVHGFFYLLTGGYYGSGDGVIIYNSLSGKSRLIFLAAAYTLTVGGAFCVSFMFSPVVKSWVSAGPSKRRFLLIVSSVSFAALLHGALTVGERMVVQDRGYAQLKTSVKDRLMTEEFTEFMEHHADQYGRDATREEIDAAWKKLKTKYRQLKIEIPVWMSVLAAFLAGYIMSGSRKDDDISPVTWKDNGVLAVLSAIIGALVVVLNCNGNVL